MDILIKNMEMPKEGRLVLAICPNGVVYEYFGDKNKYGGYRIDSAQKYLAKSPAVEVKPHGDLKDETDIIHRIEKIADADLAQDIIGEILASPTIVEATE